MGWRLVSQWHDRRGAVYRLPIITTCPAAGAARPFYLPVLYYSR